MRPEISHVCYCGQCGVRFVHKRFYTIIHNTKKTVYFFHPPTKVQHTTQHSPRAPHPLGGLESFEPQLPLFKTSFLERYSALKLRHRGSSHRAAHMLQPYLPPRCYPGAVTQHTEKPRPASTNMSCISKLCLRNSSVLLRCKVRI